ncbi:MAG: methyl-accepting chemotaxis protein [Halopseudomonas sp.]
MEVTRAGEQSRSFAVVADEVRALASRTGQSTIETRETIKRIQQQTRRTHEAISQAVAGLKAVSDKAKLRGSF